MFDAESQRSFQIVESYSIYAIEKEDIVIEESTVFDYIQNPVLIAREIDLIDKDLSTIKTKLIIEKEFHSSETINLQFKSIPTIKKNLDILELELKKLLSNGYTDLHSSRSRFTSFQTQRFVNGVLRVFA